MLGRPTYEYEQQALMNCSYMYLQLVSSLTAVFSQELYSPGLPTSSLAAVHRTATPTAPIRLRVALLKTLFPFIGHKGLISSVLLQP